MYKTIDYCVGVYQNVELRDFVGGCIKIQDYVTFVETRFIASVVAAIHYVVNQIITYQQKQTR